MREKGQFLNRRLFLFLFLLSSFSFAESNKSEPAEEPPNIGNFSLPTAQQPGPFFSFGQNIIDKNLFIASLNPNYLHSKNQHNSQITSSFLYGLTDSASVLVSLPVTLDYQNGTQHLSGLSDISIDLEYAFYNHDTSRYSDQATILIAPTLPTSSSEKIPHIDRRTGHVVLPTRSSGFSRKNAPTSNGSTTYFLGGTYSRTYVDWYGFVSPGLLLTTSHNSIHPGSQYTYNLGLGRNIKSVENKYIFFGLLELNGQFTEKTKFRELSLPNTGGNLIYATPSLWLSTEKISVQVGISIPVSQYWYGNQSAIDYYAATIITWTFS